jgi:hypothetical protein
MAIEEEKGVVETVTDAFSGSGKKLDKKLPGSVFAIVGLMYPFLLAVVLLSLALFLWLR